MFERRTFIAKFRRSSRSRSRPEDFSRNWRFESKWFKHFANSAYADVIRSSQLVSLSLFGFHLSHLINHTYSIGTFSCDIFFELASMQPPMNQKTIKHSISRPNLFVLKLMARSIFALRGIPILIVLKIRDSCKKNKMNRGESSSSEREFDKPWKIFGNFALGNFGEALISLKWSPRWGESTRHRDHVSFLLLSLISFLRLC